VPTEIKLIQRDLSHEEKAAMSSRFDMGILWNDLGGGRGQLMVDPVFPPNEVITNSERKALYVSSEMKVKDMLTTLSKRNNAAVQIIDKLPEDYREGSMGEFAKIVSQGECFVRFGFRLTMGHAIIQESSRSLKAEPILPAGGAGGEIPVAEPIDAKTIDSARSMSPKEEGVVRPAEGASAKREEDFGKNIRAILSTKEASSSAALPRIESPKGKGGGFTK